MPAFIIRGSGWSEVPPPQLNVSGAVRQVSQGWVLTGGVWKPIWNAGKENYNTIRAWGNVDRVMSLLFDYGSGWLCATTEQDRRTRWEKIYNPETGESWDNPPTRKAERYFNSLSFMKEAPVWNQTHWRTIHNTREGINLLPPNISNRAGIVSPTDYDPGGQGWNDFSLFVTYDHDEPRLPIYGAAISSSYDLTTPSPIYVGPPDSGYGNNIPQVRFDYTAGLGGGYGTSSNIPAWKTGFYVGFRLPEAKKINTVDIRLAFGDWKKTRWFYLYYGGIQVRIPASGDIAKHSAHPAFSPGAVYMIGDVLYVNYRLPVNSTTDLISAKISVSDIDYGFYSNRFNGYEHAIVKFN